MIELTEPPGRLPRLIRDRLSLRGQLVVLTGVLASLVALGLVVVVQLCLAGVSNNAVARGLQDRADALTASIESVSSGSVLEVPRQQLGPGVAVYDEHGARIAGTVPPSMQDAFASLAVATSPQTVDAGESYEILAKPFTTADGTNGVAVVTEPRAPYERDEQAALVVSIIAGALLVIFAAGSAAWISRRALSPVARMATTAEEWREHDLDRRFDLGPPTNEIRALGRTLDGLLDKVAHVIRAEQRLTGELAHELRTPLTAAQGLAELLAARDDLDEQVRADIAMIHAACSTMSNTITVLLQLARDRSTSLSRDSTCLGDLAQELRAMPHPSGDLRIELASSLLLDAPQGLVLRALAPVIDNALRLSERVTVRARQRGRQVDLAVADDGPGIEHSDVENLFSPGWSTVGGSGLGLSLARRIARSAGGDVTLAERHNSEGGATFLVTLPAIAGPTLSRDS